MSARIAESVPEFLCFWSAWLSFGALATRSRMEQSVTINYRWTFEEFLQAYRYHFRHTCRPMFRFGLHFIFGLVLLAGIVGLVRGGDGFSAVPIAFVVVGMYWFTLRPYERRWILRRQFAKQPAKDTPIEWQFAPDKIAAKSGLGHGEYLWQAFTKVVRTPTGLMLYSTDQIYHWLPRHAFVSDADYERVIELLKSKIQSFYDVS